MAFVDMPLAVLSLTAFPPECYLYRWSTHLIRAEVIQQNLQYMILTTVVIDPFPPTKELSGELITDDILNPIISLFSFPHILSSYIVSPEVALNLGQVHRPPPDQHSA